MPESPKGDAEGEKPPAPTVFMSYSYDSPEHKMWVARLATDLRTNGVDAALDQWDLHPGMDAAHFMESGIRGANRVCMICTPSYARKADAGEGGVGYEKMIVTGELYTDVGSDKFIPIIRAGSANEALPSFLKSRVYIDFRNDEGYEEKLEELLHEIHEVRATPPPLGKTPFAGGVAASPKRPALVPVVLPATLTPGKVYATCGELCRTRDTVGWRKMVKRTRREVFARLCAWRENYAQSHFSSEKEFAPAQDEAVEAAMPLYALALTGVESGMKEFLNQRSVVDYLLEMTDWPVSGRSVVVELPAALVYVYFHLHGATCMATGQQALALQCALMPVMRRSGDQSKPLWLHRDLTGWPTSIGGNCKKAWDYLNGLYARFSWLEELFGTKRDYETTLAASSLFLSVLELAHTILREECKETLRARDGRFGAYKVPPMFLFNSVAVIRRALRDAFPDSEHVGLIADAAGVDADDLRKFWRAWLEKLIAAFCDWRQAMDMREKWPGDLP